MNHELMMWEGVRVLPYDPWSARQPDWWEVQAAIRALAETNDVVIVDAGQGGLIETVPDLRSGMQVIAAELSVMGLARASRTGPDWIHGAVKRHISSAWNHVALHVGEATWVLVRRRTI